jgi:hypothetical protein
LVQFVTISTGFVWLEVGVSTWRSAFKFEFFLSPNIKQSWILHAHMEEYVDFLISGCCLCREAVQRNTDMEAGGQFGGQAHTAWFFRKRVSSTGSTWICILTKCYRQFAIMWMKIGAILTLLLHQCQ